MSERTLVITSCSKKKLEQSASAKDLYQGQFFKGVLHFCERLGFDLYILSAKYGLVAPNTRIDPYDHYLESYEEVQEMQQRIESTFPKLLDEYNKVILIMGSRYCEVFRKYLSNSKIIIAKDHRGSGGFLQLVSSLQKVSKNRIYSLISSEKPFFTIDDITPSGGQKCLI